MTEMTKYGFSMDTTDFDIVVASNKDGRLVYVDIDGNVSNRRNDAVRLFELKELVDAAVEKVKELRKSEETDE